MTRFLSVLLLTVLVSGVPRSSALELRGQASAISVWDLDHTAVWQWIVRYIPTLTGGFAGSSVSLDGALSLNTRWMGHMKGSGVRSESGDLSLYRGWIRFTTPRFECRVGRQKISFGSAAMLRPLMWFDRIDPRDPLQITEGVNAILFRYYFMNNTNIWFWGLGFNTEVKGWEVFPSAGGRPELGGRIQTPLLKGEFAVTCHYRTADLSRGTGGLFLGDRIEGENRFGLDGKWDAKVGLWFEAVWIHLPGPDFLPPWQRLVTVGADYTFGLGNGLHVMSEYFEVRAVERAFDRGEGMRFSALSLNYPLGFLDRITGMLYFDWEHREWYRFINFQRTLDQWQFFIMGFWNPDAFQIYTTRDINLFAGKGIQVMAVFNH
ncbi:MAG TPA: hypothetical protein ENN03_10415 [bacterium]|mgnify:CR=1 FL=1|nr:hypothetical protein [bacterium]